MIDQELLNCFLDEALDSLTQWERACLDLETSANAETWGVLFRAAHNLKGASRAVGLDEFGHFVHQIEDLITILMKGVFPTNPQLIGTLLQCQVELVKWIEELRTNAEAKPPIDGLTSKLEAVSKLTPDDLAFIAQALTDPTTVIPAATQQSIRQATERINSQSTPPVAGKPAAPAADDLDSLFAAAQQEYSAKATPPPSQPAPVAATAAPKAPEAPAKADTAAPKADAKAQQKPDETIRISANKLDELLQLIGELSIHQAIVLEGKRSKTLDSRMCHNAIHLSQKIVKDLYSKALSLRMQPVQGLFQRLERVARDVARSQNKKIQIQLEGTDVELDKTVIERITDPLVHILRNAVDHGIETPEERGKTNKGDSATVSLVASQEAAGVCIRVIDDGRGLNRDRILKKAIEKGLIQAGQELSKQQINNLIFLPNFSTAEKVTDISGRGVGMDVVMKAVQALQGQIDIESEPGKGTTFSIMLPTSLSIVEALVVKLQDTRYAVAMHELTEIIDLGEFSIETSGSKGRMISLRGNVVPVQNLNDYFRVPVVRRADGKAHATSEGGKPALVVREGEDLVAYEVDDVLGQQQIVVRPLSQQMSGLPGFSGSMIMGDGEPGMIVSLSEITRSYLKSTSPKEVRA